jgi:hypothetical protein
MKFPKVPFFLLFLLLIIYTLNAGCNSNTAPKNYDQILRKREKQASEKRTDSLGVLLDTVDFQVKTNDLANYPDGVIPWINLDKPDKDLLQLVQKDEVVIHQNKVTVIIDYPLTNEYKFTLTSDVGFTRARLVKEISRAYYKIYQEEEATASVKTIPVKERTTTYNRNQTNGKYGVWGHDIADLVLTYVIVYRSPNGEILLSLVVDS